MQDKVQLMAAIRQSHMTFNTTREHLEMVTIADIDYLISDLIAKGQPCPPSSGWQLLDRVT